MRCALVLHPKRLRQFCIIVPVALGTLVGQAAGAASVQLTVFDGSASSAARPLNFVISPALPEKRPEGSFTVPSAAVADDVVRNAMLDGFAISRSVVPAGGVRSLTFSGSPSAGSFVRVPQWMRTGILPSPMPRSAPIMIGSCGGRPYRPSMLLHSTAETRRRMLFPLVQQAACEAGLPVALMDAMLIQESGYNPWISSPKGAFGLGQLMPDTARYLGVDRYDIRGNLKGAARYLREHLTEFGDASLALAAYNAGPGRVRKSRGVPNITETKDYVRSILRNWLVLENNERSMSWPKQ